MSAERIQASVLVFPTVDVNSVPAPSASPEDLLSAQPGAQSFSLDVEQPNVITLFTAGANSGDDIMGTLHFPELLANSRCRNISELPTTSLVDDLSKTSNVQLHVIGFAPWVPDCNTEFLDRARDDRADISGFFFYTLDYIDSIPGAGNHYWGGIKLRDYNFPIYGMRGREGAFLMDRYTEYATNKSLLDDIHNTTGRARIFVEVGTGRPAPLPGLWLFLLIVLAVLVLILGLTSLSMHLLQYRRRRSLRRRVMAGEVDLEALGIKRLTVPRRILDKFPLRPFTLDKDDGYSQQSCSICLEDFVVDGTTVRELPCKHIYHPACIDGFLEQQSSLCPLCKSSALPKGYLPKQLTNRTVRRERYLRRQRERAEREAAQGGSRDPTPAWLMGITTILWGDIETRRANNRAVRGNVEMRNRPPASRRERRSVAAPASDVEDEGVRRGKFRRAMRAVFPGFR